MGTGPSRTAYLCRILHFSPSWEHCQHLSRDYFPQKLEASSGCQPLLHNSSHPSAKEKYKGES